MRRKGMKLPNTPREIPSLSNLVNPILGPDDAAVVVTYNTEPMHVMVVPRADAERALRLIVAYLDELGFGPEYDVMLGTRQTPSTMN